MIWPLAAMVFSMPLFLIYTGWKNSLTDDLKTIIWNSIGNGSGSSAVTYAIVFALFIAALMMGIQKDNTSILFRESIKGMNDMLIMAILMVLAFALGALCKELQTGIYVAQITENWLSPSMAPFVLFITSCFVAFSAGTSWGTFAIMISIVIPLIETMGLHPYLSLAAVLGGGVFLEIIALLFLIQH